MRNSFILIADDDADDKLLLETAFQEIGFTGKVKFVSNGEELTEFLQRLDKSENPGVIILDLNMPRKTGLEVLKELRSNNNFKNVHIVVFSTTKNETEVQDCIKLGADSYFVKPINYNALLEFAKSINNVLISPL
ncbi:response regulator [Pollutibacter soli]|uniref:response regulator n=1 Tax=Pollutibacter soli TaxID=3034157 RepID=UPI003013E37D